MKSDILNKIYANEMYLTYLRYHPHWYQILNNNPSEFSRFEREVKMTLKITTADKIDNLRKQVDFVNGIIKYLSH